MRDLDHLQRLAAGHGPAIGGYAAVLLDHPLPWTKMRQVYALLGLVKKWGPDRVEAACARAAEAEAFNVALIGRMLDRGLEGDTRATAGQPVPTAATDVGGGVVAGSVSTGSRRGSLGRPATSPPVVPDGAVRSGQNGGAA